jgi:alpha-beta hydrolase superfamily lysophospholipase
MEKSRFPLTSPDGMEISVIRWQPDTQAKAFLQIVHGLAEHAERYDRLARALTASGYAVYASDLRGHGQTARTRADLGCFAERDGWSRCLDDLWQVNRAIASANSGGPVFLLGHSMGSTLARHLMALHGDALAGVVLSAASGQPTLMASSGRLTTRLERLRLGRRGISKLLESLTFEAFNRRFAPARTPFDWLSRDPVEVDKYIADPLCGFPATVQLWIDLLDAWAWVSRPGNLTGIPRQLPILVISGEHDPVSEGTKMLVPMLKQYRRAGLTKVEHKFYPEARHELFNETNREDVTADLVEWLGKIG